MWFWKIVKLDCAKIRNHIFIFILILIFIHVGGINQAKTRKGEETPLAKEAL